MSNMTDTTSRAGISYPLGAHEFILVFTGFRVAQSLDFCLMCCR